MDLTGWKERESVSHSVVSNCLTIHGLQPPRLLCPWNSPGKNTGVVCHFLLQGILPQPRGLNSGPLHCRQSLYHLSHSTYFQWEEPTNEGQKDSTEMGSRGRGTVLSTGEHLPAMGIHNWEGSQRCFFTPFPTFYTSDDMFYIFKFYTYLNKLLWF